MLRYGLLDTPCPEPGALHDRVGAGASCMDSIRRLACRSGHGRGARIDVLLVRRRYPANGLVVARLIADRHG